MITSKKAENNTIYIRRQITQENKKQVFKHGWFWVAVGIGCEINEIE